MAKKIITNYEQAETEDGAKVLKYCRNELMALAGIVSTRCLMSERESVYALRDAFQMIGAADADLHYAKQQAELERLQAELAKGNSCTSQI